MSTEYTHFDKEQIYKKEIAPLLLKIRSICKINNIPFASAFAIKNDDKETTYEFNGVLTGSMHVNLADDRFERVVIAMQKSGFHMVPDRPISEMENEDILSLVNSIAEDENEELEDLQDEDEPVPDFFGDGFVSEHLGEI